jgi:hypothetical protein
VSKSQMSLGQGPKASVKRAFNRCGEASFAAVDWLKGDHQVTLMIPFLRVLCDIPPLFFLRHDQQHE